MEEDNKEKIIAGNNKFIYGFLLGLLAYLINVMFAIIVIMIVWYSKFLAIGLNIGLFNYLFNEFSGSFFIFGAIIWIPLSIIAGFISKNEGIIRCILFLTVSIAVILIVLGTCRGINFGL